MGCNTMADLTKAKCRELCIHNAACKYMLWSPDITHGHYGNEAAAMKDKCVLYSGEPTTTTTKLTTTTCFRKDCERPAYCPTTARFRAASDHSKCCAGSTRCATNQRVGCGAKECVTHPDALMPQHCHCTQEYKPVWCSDGQVYGNKCKAHCALKHPVSGACHSAKCTCHNGIANSGADCASHDEHNCASCRTDFYLDGKLCKAQPYCGQGQYMSPQSATQRRSCHACPANTYQPSTSHRQTVCLAQPTCGQGQKISTDSKI